MIGEDITHETLPNQPPVEGSAMQPYRLLSMLYLKKDVHGRPCYFGFTANPEKAMILTLNKKLPADPAERRKVLMSEATYSLGYIDYKAAKTSREENGQTIQETVPVFDLAQMYELGKGHLREGQRNGTEFVEVKSPHSGRFYHVFRGSRPDRNGREYLRLNERSLPPLTPEQRRLRNMLGGNMQEEPGPTSPTDTTGASAQPGENVNLETGEVTTPSPEEIGF
jgi:hypothetical protein